MIHDEHSHDNKDFRPKNTINTADSIRPMDSHSSVGNQHLKSIHDKSLDKTMVETNKTSWTSIGIVLAVIAAIALLTSYYN